MKNDERGPKDKANVRVTGILSEKSVVIPPEELGAIKFDPGYQRPEVPAVVLPLADALANGGTCPAPAILVDRSNRPKEEQGLFCVDGKQRTHAHVAARKPMRAIIFTVVDHDAERRMFVAGNIKTSVSRNLLVFAWPDMSADLLRKVNADSEHGLCGRVRFDSFSEGEVAHPLVASALICGMNAAADGERRRGNIACALVHCDRALRIGAKAARVREYLNLAAAVFPDPISATQAEALGIVAFRRWGNNPKPVTDRVLTKLRGVPWMNRNVFPRLTTKFLGVAILEVEKRWPAS